MAQKLEDFFSRTERHRFLTSANLHPFAVCVLIIGLHIFGMVSGHLERVENIFLDAFFRQRPPLGAHPDVVIIEINKESLQAIGPWPWPWRYHEQMIRILKSWQARGIVFDFAFPNLKEAQQDQNLKAVFESKDKVYLPVSLEVKTGKKIYVHDLPVVLEPEGERKSWIHSIPELEKNARAVGHTHLRSDPDGVLRKIEPYLSESGESYPYLALPVAFDYLGQELPVPGNLALPLDRKGELRVHWLGKWPETFERYSYADLVRSAQVFERGSEPVISPEKIKGKICLIGITAPGLAVFKSSPLESPYPTVGVHATVISNLASGRLFIPASLEANVFCLSVIGFIASIFFVMSHKVRSFVFGLMLGAFWLALAFILFWKKGIWVYAAQPLLLILSLFVFSAIYSLLVSGREQSKLFDLATRDGLTGLYVIRHFREILNHLVSEAYRKRRSLCLILIDIDHFKMINDTHGHPAGDMILKNTARLIQSCLRTTRGIHEADFIARYGGEEFIVVLRNVDLKQAAFKIAERIRDTVQKAVFEWEDKIIPVTISLGVANLHSDENFPDPMVRRADEALYRAKGSGRNRVCIETVAGGS